MSESRSSNADASGSALFALITIILLAAIVRLWGIDFGLPHTLCRPDESRLVNTAIRFGGGDLNPHLFNYPTLYPYTLFLCYGVYFLAGMVVGKFNSVDTFILEFSTDPGAFYLIDRLLVAFLGTATVYIVYRIATRLYGRGVALVSSAFMALAYLHVRDSHFGVTDVPMTFLIMCAVLLLLRAVEDKTSRSYLLAGIVAGLAASVKYAGLMLLMPMLMTHISIVRSQGKRWLEVLFDRRPLIFAAALVVAFLIGTPYALLDHSQFIRDFTFEMDHLAYGHRGIILDRGWWHHLHFSLWHGLGWPLLTVSLVGIVCIVRKDPRKALIFLSFPLLYYVVAGRGYTVFARYMIPVVPFLCITGAVCVTCLARWIAKRRDGCAEKIAVLLLAALTLLPSMRSVVAFNSLASLADNRLIASQWVHTQIPHGSSIYQAGSLGARLQINPGQFFISKYEQHEAVITAGLHDHLSTNRLRRIVDSLIDRRLYEEWSFHKDSNVFVSRGVKCQGWPDYIISEESPLAYYGQTAPYIKQLIETDYRMVKRFEAVDVSEPANSYDQQDLFYLPYAGFKGIQRPGPNINIYERISGK